MQTGWIIATIGMTILAIVDIRERAISIAFILLFDIMAVLYVAMKGDIAGISVLYALIPGAFLLAVGLCTRESVGYGDGWIVLALGLLIGAEGCFLTVCMGLIFSAIFSLVLLILHKVNGKSRLPFLPFLTIGLGVLIVGQKGF